MRSLVGLDREAAKKLFADFDDGRTLTADQHEFLDLVIDHARGVVDPALLYETPFTDFDSNGVEGLFETCGCHAPGRNPRQGGGAQRGVTAKRS